MFMHPHPSGPALHFRNIARIDLAIRQCRDTFEAIAFRFCYSAVFDLLNSPGYHSAWLFIHFLRKPSFPQASLCAYKG